MPGKIFYRKSSRSDRRERGRNLRVVAVADVDLKFFSSHYSKSELKLIASEAGAELIDLGDAGSNRPK